MDLAFEIKTHPKFKCPTRIVKSESGTWARLYDQIKFATITQALFPLSCNCQWIETSYSVSELKLQDHKGWVTYAKHVVSLGFSLKQLVTLKMARTCLDLVKTLELLFNRKHRISTPLKLIWGLTLK